MERFKKNLKHKKEDISLEQLGNHLRLEEEYRKQDAEKETNVQEKPQEGEEETIATIRERQKWENDDYICTGHILNGLCDALFDVYQDSTSAKDLWDKLEVRYMQEGTFDKVFIVS
ncbi:putative polyprotein, related [Senna tora]|uniref:Putative polyprotein, related n=1 Tax=Senna tora TaxID=362788 RepID=A0A834XBG9_9FABA|nr:putative polyprotein, related [Senna tora]